MKAVMVMFDSLNRHMLPPYGAEGIFAPNFSRLAEHSLTFDSAYVCSMPCMPARRDLHTGRPHFLHRGWGPLEPFDDSMPQMLGRSGVYTHLVTDHYHYFEDGGGTYHNRYSSWEFFRGQEGDHWIGQVEDPIYPEAGGRLARRDSMTRQDLVNRRHIRGESEMPQARTFAAGVDFIRRNSAQDNWMLQIETFDPHEPFFTQRRHKDLYPEDYMGPVFDWPSYEEATEPADQIEHCRREYKALLSMCDSYLGNVLDVFDELSLWDDTMLIVWTDHGFLLGEHGWWGKMRMPWYEELARTPFFVWDPRTGKRGERRESLVQPAIDIAPTLLEYFRVDSTSDMLGKSLAPVIANDTPVRAAGLFGVFGGQVNVTDGRYVYMRASEDASSLLCEHTLMPAYMTSMFPIDQLKSIELSGPFSFTKGCRLMRVATAGSGAWCNDQVRSTLLFDVQADPGQGSPIKSPEIEKTMSEHLVRLMRECDAPPEQFARLGLVP